MSTYRTQLNEKDVPNEKMLVLGREIRGITQKELVERIPNLTQGNYSRMELGTLSIPTDTLREIANTLDFPLSFFFKPTSIRTHEEYFYRKRISLPVKEQKKLEANFSILRDIFNTLLSDVEISEFTFPEIECTENNTPSQIAKKIRAYLKLENGPINNLIQLLERNGIVVYFYKNGPEKFDGTTIITEDNHKIIIVNDDIPDDRKRFTICHELGHLVMHLPFSAYLSDIYERDVEKEANDFASEFLMPENDISDHLRYITYGKLSDLKFYWKTSKSSLIRRAKSLKIIDEKRYKNLLIELSRNGERTNELSPIKIEPPVLLKKIVDVYFSVLGFSKEELMNILYLNTSDFDTLVLGKNNYGKLKIVI